MGEAKQRWQAGEIGLRINMKGRNDPGRGAKIASVDAEMKRVALDGQYRNTPKRADLSRQAKRYKERSAAKRKRLRP